MKLVHTITLSLFVKPDEDKLALRALFVGLVPFSLADEKIVLKESSATTLDNRAMSTFEIMLSKERHTKAFIDFLNKNLPAHQKQQLIEQENRVDEECNFYLRFEKNHLPKLMLTDSGNCVHCKMAIAAFPKKREQALTLVKELFKEQEKKV
jgi:RNA binding exosome subunit